MAFRKLQFKNVQDTRSSQVIGEGELAIDPVTNQLYLGDGSTSGGVAVAGGYERHIVKTAEFTVEVGKRYYADNGPYDINLPASSVAGDWFEIANPNSGVTVQVQTSPQIGVTGTSISRFVYNGTTYIKFDMS